MSRKLIIFFIACVLIGTLVGLWAGTQRVAGMYDHLPALGERLEIAGWHLYPPWQWLVWRRTWPPDMLAMAQRPMSEAFALLMLGIMFGMLPAILWRAMGGLSVRRVRELGKDRWATLTDMQSAGLVHDRASGTIVGEFEGRLLSFQGIEHQLVIGPSRSGKGVGHVVPTLLVWPESCFCYDVKGELWKLTAAHRRRFGHVLLWNPTRPDSARYNPLLEVRKDAETGDVQKIAKMLVNPGGNRADDDIWDRSAEQLLTALILHVLYTEPDDRKHLGVVREKVLDLNNTLIDMLELPHLLDGGRLSVHPEVQRVAASFADKTARFRSSVAGTLEAYLTIFADPKVVYAISACDFRMSDLACAERGMTLYIQVPPADIERMRPLTRLIVDQACRALLHDEASDAWGRQKNRTTLMMLDEFPSLGQIDAFANHMKLMASFRLKGFLVVQSINDIIGTYGVNNTIIDNAHIVVAFATADVTSLERISRMTGMVTEYRESYSRPNRLLGGLAGRGSVSESEHVRPLMTPGDVRELPYDEQIILINGTRPMRTKKVVYHQLPQFQKLLEGAREQTDGQSFPPSWKSEWLGERAKGERVFHPLAAKLREELNRSDVGPESTVTVDSPARLPSLFDMAPEETPPGQPVQRTDDPSAPAAASSRVVADVNGGPAVRSSAAAIADGAPAEEKPKGITAPAKEIPAVVRRMRRLI